MLSYSSGFETFCTADLYEHLIEIVFLSTCRVEMQIYAFHKLCLSFGKNTSSCYIFHNINKLVPESWVLFFFFFFTEKYLYH